MLSTCVQSNVIIATAEVTMEAQRSVSFGKDAELTYLQNQIATPTIKGTLFGVYRYADFRDTFVLLVSTVCAVSAGILQILPQVSGTSSFPPASFTNTKLSGPIQSSCIQVCQGLNDRHGEYRVRQRNRCGNVVFCLFTPWLFCLRLGEYGGLRVYW